jgi:hypothetical protein
LLLSFAVTTGNPVVSDRCRLLADEYQSLAAMLGDDQPEVASAVQTVLKRADELIAPWRVVVLLRVTADEHSSAAFWHRSA